MKLIKILSIIIAVGIPIGLSAQEVDSTQVCCTDSTCMVECNCGCYGCCDDFIGLKYYNLPKCSQDTVQKEENNDLEIKVKETPVIIPIEQPALVPVIMKKKDRSLLFIKTNTLYWLGLVPNISLELPLGKNWTIGGQYHHAWWKRGFDRFIWKTYGGEFFVRKYIPAGKKKFAYTGHHIGLSGMAFTYNFETWGKGIMAKKPNYACGLEYGYDFRITDHFDIDLTLGLGYSGGIYEQYIPLDGHYVWQATKRRNYFGPTKCELTFRWVICRKEGGKK